ncbi:hypothetical protein ASPCAL09649 [Aspergillus calidoustus]|uniref:Uncharacterized protein n=1 Tax=Aspergillus calidoustus TaxID=454130 RepID=A0A0U5G815_ASPCI|nr:hypothetical protein ASPCAL09649 [Aspergillus calidoustus]
MVGKVTATMAALMMAAVSRAWEDGVDCTSTSVDAAEGLLYVHDSSGLDVYCDDIDDIVSADNGYSCYRTTSDSSSLGDIVKCPGDPAPKKNPDGSDVDAEIASGVVSAYCNSAGDPLVFVNTIGCLLFAYYEANGDPVAEAEAGGRAVCDTIFSGACTYFIDVAPAIAEGMDKPCIDDPGSNACAFANPGK